MEDGHRGGTGSVVGRALCVLEAFTPATPVLTLTDISRHTELPLTTVYRLVKELTAHRVLERETGGGYRIGLHLWEIAALAPRGLGLRELALPYLSDLGHVTRENVQLAVREELSVLYVERLAGRNSVRVLTRVGGRFALAPTGVGRVLLAHAPAEVQERVLAQPMVAYTEHTLRDPARLRRILAEVRHSGVAVCPRQVTPDGLSVAAPVHGAGGEVVAAVSVVAHVDRAEPRALIPLVQVAARGISRALGAPLPPADDGGRAGEGPGAAGHARLTGT
ncbi:IclR family transcriptional regulator [Streptomyces sulfonofaciens]|uniref:IclR family transcriptional regulator n=1 Tax=Streptomyces sulfonofaciens TaxID=68272 RepID=A0A919FVA5_9ACTN|nr:IclR family transcriptional regulator [Streptomyces sulfonofaciens]GHH73082.1 IclR family transcriptional regulator [Streptomyces sulfonofaciens]